jgi:hypothetical protein
MKFLCVSCDEAMRLVEARPPERGSVTVLFRCPGCGFEFAMLTNPHETQVVGSLGVRLGGAAGGEEAAGCPFSGVLREAGAGADAAAGALPWTADAAARLARIPEFARPMARSGIENFAREHGFAQIDAQVLDRAKGFFGM